MNPQQEPQESPELKLQTGKLKAQIESMGQDKSNLMKINKELNDNISVLRDTIRSQDEHIKRLQTEIGDVKTTKVADLNLDEQFDIGDAVNYVNHSGHNEAAKVLAINGDRATLDVQGKHPNDKRKVEHVKYDKTRSLNTFHETL